MNSKTNDTKYDDKLFFEILNDCTKKLFICPCEKPYEIKKSQNTKLTILKPGTNYVIAAASGKLHHTDTNILILEHENNVYTTYKNVTPLTNKEKIKQGDKIAEFKDSFSFSINIKPAEIAELPAGENNV